MRQLKHDQAKGESQNSNSNYPSNLLNSLDDLDKLVSRPFFLAKLPLVFEYALSVPGNFFGVPLVALSLTPNLIALYFCHETPPNSWLAAACVLTAIILMLWAFVLQGKAVAIRTFYGPALGALAPAFGISLLCSLSEETRQVGYFQIAAWCLSVVPVALLKPFISRARPCLLKGDHDKHLSILPKLFTRDGRASFPSGDAAGAVAVMYPLIRCGDNIGVCVGVTGVCLSIIGRMYWKAHHFGDVMVGAGLALGCCWLLEQHMAQDGGCCRAQLWQALSMHATLLVTVIASRLWFKVRLFQSGTISTEEKKR